MSGKKASNASAAAAKAGAGTGTPKGPPTGPSLTLTPLAGPVGTVVAASGANFAGTSCALSSSPGGLFTSSSCTISATALSGGFTVDSGAAAGSYTVTATSNLGSSDSASASFSVTKPLPHTETKLDKVVAFLVAIYTLLVFTVAMLSLLAIWPRTPGDLALNATRSITFPMGLGGAVALGPEILLATTIVLAGVVGACVYSLYAISLHLGNYKDFDRAWTAWYMLRLPIGAGMAFIMYVLVRGGILTVGADLKNLNLLGLTGISTLVGLFSEHAMNKLLDLADSMFGKTPDKPSGSNDGKDKAQKA